MSLAQKGLKLLQEATQDISFGSSNESVLYTWRGKEKSLQEKDKTFRKIFKETLNEFNIKKANASAAKQANKAAVIAKKCSIKAINNLSNEIENKIYDMKYKTNNPSKKRKSNATFNNKYKKRKYNLSIRTNFDDWNDFTSYVKNEKEKMKIEKMKKENKSSKNKFKDWKTFTQHLKKEKQSTH